MIFYFVVGIWLLVGVGVSHKIIFHINIFFQFALIKVHAMPLGVAGGLQWLHLTAGFSLFYSSFSLVYFSPRRVVLGL
jgi:hypothetical protein